MNQQVSQLDYQIINLDHIESSIFSVTNEYDFVEDTNDPWHNYKLWKNSKNVEKEIEVGFY